MIQIEVILLQRSIKFSFFKGIISKFMFDFHSSYNKTKWGAKIDAYHCLVRLTESCAVFIFPKSYCSFGKELPINYLAYIVQMTYELWMSSASKKRIGRNAKRIHMHTYLLAIIKQIQLLCIFSYPLYSSQQLASRWLQAFFFMELRFSITVFYHEK